MRFLIAVTLLVTARPALAQKAADAKSYYERATAHFAVGEFAKAADEYQQAYTLRPDPALLYNAAQSYRLAGNNEKALILYKNYVQLYPNQPNVDEVRNQIAKLKEAMTAQEKPPTTPPTATVAVTPTAPPTATPSRTRNELVAQPERKPITRKPWFWATLGTAALVVAGVTVGVVLGTQPHAPTATVGRVNGN